MGQSTTISMCNVICSLAEPSIKTAPRHSLNGEKLWLHVSQKPWFLLCTELTYKRPLSVYIDIIVYLIYQIVIIDSKFYPCADACWITIPELDKLNS